jgi:hypothetical protein
VTEGTGEEDSPAAPDVRLEDVGELLYRQVHPTWVEDGVPSSQAFAPTRKDKGKLSIARGRLVTAEDAYRHYTDVLGLSSAGTWAVMVGEARTTTLESFAEPLHDDPAHGYVDFRELGRREAERKAKLLLPHAVDRGRLHP